MKPQEARDVPDGQFYAYDPAERKVEIIGKKWIRVNHDGDFFEMRAIEGGVEIRLTGNVVHRLVVMPEVSNTVHVVGVPMLDNGSVKTRQARGEGE